MWASGHNGDIKRAAQGYEPTREAAMQRSLKASVGSQATPESASPWKTAPD